jgi:peptidyl-prolyl cis-trans isomerase C
MFTDLRSARAAIFCISAALINSSNFVNIPVANAEPVEMAGHATPPPSLLQVTPETVLATVKGKPITVAEVDKQIEMKPNFAYYFENAKKNPKLLHDLRTRVMNAMINRTILFEEAEKSGVVVQKEVDESVKKVIDGYGGKEKLTELLTAIKTDISTFESEIRKDFAINAYIDRVVLKDVQVSDEEIAAEFNKSPSNYAQKESVQASHILIKLEADANDEKKNAAKSKIDTLYQQLTKEKKDFAALAKENSDCPSSQQGGDLGTFGKGSMVPEFEQRAFSTPVGGISEPFTTQFGYHIVKVTAHNPEKPGELKSSSKQIKEEIIAKKRETLVEAKIAELKKSYAVTIKSA